MSDETWAEDGGSYRSLIYDKLGFETDAYMVLYGAGGMAINNELDLSDGKEIVGFKP